VRVSGALTMSFVGEGEAEGKIEGIAERAERREPSGAATTESRVKCQKIKELEPNEKSRDCLAKPKPALTECMLMSLVVSSAFSRESLKQGSPPATTFALLALLTRTHLASLQLTYSTSCCYALLPLPFETAGQR